MTTATHTAAPWQAKKLTGPDSVGWAILWKDATGPGHRQRRLDFKGQFTAADAHLIAAAPEMLQVLLELESSAAYWSEYDVPIGIVDRIKAAIAKATDHIE